MKNNYVLSIVLILLGGLIAIGPRTLFPICNQNKMMQMDNMQQGKTVEENSSMNNMKMDSESTDMKQMKTEKIMKMKCYYTANAELITGILIVIFAGVLLVLNRKKLRIIFAGIDALLGVLVVLFPTVLIGVCKPIHANCHALTAKVLVILGILTVVFSVLVLFRERRTNEG